MQSIEPTSSSCKSRDDLRPPSSQDTEAQREFVKAVDKELIAIIRSNQDDIDIRDGYFPYFVPDTLSMQEEINNYLEGKGSEVIEKYLFKENSIDPAAEENKEEFCQLYLEVIRNCFKRSKNSLGMASSKSNDLLSSFDALYEINRDRFTKVLKDQIFLEKKSSFGAGNTLPLLRT